MISRLLPMVAIVGLTAWPDHGWTVGTAASVRPPLHPIPAYASDRIQLAQGKPSKTPIDPTNPGGPQYAPQTNIGPAATDPPLLAIPVPHNVIHKLSKEDAERLESDSPIPSKPAAKAGQKP